MDRGKAFTKFLEIKGIDSFEWTKIIPDKEQYEKVIEEFNDWLEKEQ